VQGDNPAGCLDRVSSGRGQVVPHAEPSSTLLRLDASHRRFYHRSRVAGWAAMGAEVW
jgi:hypothetical protein